MELEIRHGITDKHVFRLYVHISSVQISSYDAKHKTKQNWG